MRDGVEAGRRIGHGHEVLPGQTLRDVGVDVVLGLPEVGQEGERLDTQWPDAE